MFYHLNDPSGRSLTITDAEGDTAWQVVYDGYGAVLTGTMPVTLTHTLLDMPDGTTGLVHLGNGRYYDPALGRPLQSNPAGAPPTVPQMLNRYAAASNGQPGVFQAAVQSGSLLSSIYRSFTSNSIEEVHPLLLMFLLAACDQQAQQNPPIQATLIPTAAPRCGEVFLF